MSAQASVPLQPADRAILGLECETIAGHTCKVIRLGAVPPSIEDLRERVAARIDAVPELAWRLGDADGEPAWVAFEGFDPSRRVVPLSDGAPLSGAEVPAAVARLFERRLDRDRPLWQMHLGELVDGGAVLIWRIHHALADGTAAMRFARELLWDAPPPGEVDLAHAQRRKGRSGDSQARSTGPESRPGSAPTAPSPATHPDDERRRRHLAAFVEREFGSSLRRSPFDGTIGTTRRIAFASVELAPLHDAAKELAGATLNDAVLSIVAGALRRWLEAHHGSLHGVRVRVPVSLHHEGDAAANLDSFFSLHLPLTVDDPVARLREVNAATRARKSAHDAEELQAFLAGLGAASPRMRALCDRVEASPRSFALSVSNVPGPRQAVSVLGSPVEAVHSIAEIGARHALRVAVVSLAGTLHFGLCADPALVDGLDEMASGIEAEAELLVAAAG